MSGLQDQPLIPTTSRSKLYSAYSHPVGAQEISSGLRDAPYFDALRLSFMGCLRQPRKGESLPPQLIMSAAFQPSGNWLNAYWSEDMWSIDVYPVLREQRHAANGLIRKVGLPLIFDWLRTIASTEGSQVRRRIDLIFDADDETLSAEESADWQPTVQGE